MLVPHMFSIATIDMDNKSCFFSVNHITNESNTKRIYGIRLNNSNYFLSKTSGQVDCEQLDTNPALDPDVLKEICEAITEIEKGHKKRPSLEVINKEILNILKRRDRL